MAALAHLSVSPALEQAGLIVEPASVSEQLDTRAFVVIPDRAEAETLFTLDHSRGVRDPEWKAFFVESLVEFLVWQSHPYGRLSESDLNWLMRLVADSPSPSTPALLFALVRKLNDVPERLVALALMHSDNRFPVRI